MGYFKWIGGALGAFSGLPLGALAGFVFGTLIDKMMDNGEGPTSTPLNSSSASDQTNEGERNGFLFSLLVLSAHIIQADGRIMHSEMEYVRRFLRESFSSDAEREGNTILLRLFEHRKQIGQSAWNRQIEESCAQLARIMPLEQRLQLMAYLCEIAKADGMVDPNEVASLRHLCLLLGLEAGCVDQMLGMGGTSLEEAYQVLGLAPDCTDDEVKKAYRRMAREYHPDHVATLGEDVKAAAERKFKEIGEAKDRIYKARGMR